MGASCTCRLSKVAVAIVEVSVDLVAVDLVLTLTHVVRHAGQHRVSIGPTKGQHRARSGRSMHSTHADRR